MSKGQKVAILSWVILGGFVLSICYHLILSHFRPGYPYNTFLFWPDARFSDYYDVIRDSQTLNPYLEFKSAQYPFLVILGYFFSRVSNGAYNFYAGLVTIGFLFLSFLFLQDKKRYINIIPIVIIALLNYPFIFALDRGNFESLLFVFLLLFVFFYTKKRYWISAFLLAFAISMKVYPAILIIWLISDKKYREVAICLASTAVISFVSLLCFKGGLWANLNYLFQGANISSNFIFTRFTSIDDFLVQRGVSLLTFIKIFYAETRLLPAFITTNFMAFYMLLVAALAAIVVLYVIFVEKEPWKKSALLIFSMLLFPTLSADYKLLHIFIPLFVFINKENKSKFDILYLILFGLLLIPKDYYYFSKVYSDTAGSHDISIAVVINIMTMLVMSGVIMVSGLRKRSRKFCPPQHKPV